MNLNGLIEIKDKEFKLAVFVFAYYMAMFLVMSKSILTKHPAGVQAVWGNTSAIILNFCLTSEGS